MKNDAVAQPTLSFKDRVVTTAINAAHALGLDTIGCASTGNLANAVAAHAARAGLPAWIFIPEDLEPAKVINTAVFGANLVRVRGHYDDVNRLCVIPLDEAQRGIATRIRNPRNNFWLPHAREGSAAPVHMCSWQERCKFCRALRTIFQKIGRAG